MECSLPGSQGIFPTQGLNPGLPNCRRILYHLSHQGNPRILEWVAYPFSWGVFPTQEPNWGLPHCGWILYLVAELPGKPKLVQQWNKNKCVWKRWFVWLLWNQLQISFWSFERLAGKKVSSVFIYLSFLKIFFFLMWTVWVFIQLVTILLLLFMFCFFLAMRHIRS